MIRSIWEHDLHAVMQIWLDANLQAHAFVPAAYWTAHFDQVRQQLPQAEGYLFEDKKTGRIEGFIGLTDDFIAGLFVRAAARSRGIGKELLDYVKQLRPDLRLRVYQKNTRAIRFYQREGFRVQSEHTEAETGETEFEMVWSRRTGSDCAGSCCSQIGKRLVGGVL